MEYDLEIERAVKEIKAAKAKRVCIQLPDGLKPKAKEIADALKAKTGAEIFIWAGTCFGACDIPAGLSGIKTDLLLQWGHNSFIRKN